MAQSPTMMLLQEAEGEPAVTALKPKKPAAEETQAAAPAAAQEAAEQPLTWHHLAQLGESGLKGFKVPELNEMGAVLGVDVASVKGKAAKVKALYEAVPEEVLAEYAQADAAKVKALYEAGKPTDTTGTLTATTDPAGLAKTLTTPEEAFKVAKQLLESEAINDIALGGVLSAIQDNGWIGEHQNFRGFIEAELGIGYRKGMYLINIYNALEALDIPHSTFAGVPWTILLALLPVLSEENVDQWLEATKGCTRAQVQEMVKQAQAAAANGDAEVAAPGETTSVTTMSFKVHPDQKEAIDAALEGAMKEVGTDVKTVALEHVCTQYNSLAGLGVGKVKPQVGTAVGHPTPSEFIQGLLEKHGGDQINALQELLADFETLFPNLTMEVDMKEGADS